ncbi:MAG: hemolysin family protein [Anaerolineales bacterium]
MIQIEWGIPLSILFVILDLLIAATRVSLLNLRPLRLLSMREQFPEPVDRTLALIEDARLRPTLRFSQTATRILLAGVILSMAGQAAGESRFALIILIVIIFLVALSLMSVEFIVEGNILLKPEHWGMRLGKFARALIFVMTPLVFLPVRFLQSQWPAPVAAQMTEDELKTWVQSDQEEGGLELEERQMIYSIFQFGETLAREIMVPRMDMLAFEVTTSLSRATKAFTQSGHSRVPVFETNIDNIIGLLYAKDLLHVMPNGREHASIRELLRPAYFVPDTKKADTLLTEMQSQRIHMAIVVDEYGGVAGLVTLEDIIEEIIGEIQDEYDLSEEDLIHQNGPDEFVFLGRIDLDDFNEVMGSDIPKVESDTLAGFLYDHFGRVPHDGESIQADGLLLTIEQIIGRRIRRVRVQRIPPDEEGDQEDATPN